jgi:hypothetical protein
MDSQVLLEELVTPIPVQKLRNKFDESIRFGQYFTSITAMMFIYLREDKCGNRLRNTLLPFDGHLCLAMQEMQRALDYATSYYAHIRETGEEDLTNTLTEQHVQMFLDKISRKNQIIYGQVILASLEEAIPILRDQALPLLPEIEIELEDFVKGYRERDDMAQKRAESWIPFGVQDFIWGSLEPTTKDVSEIAILRLYLERGTLYLQKLLKFLEDLKDHFQRMTSLTRADYEVLGYSSIEESRRLHANRLRCSSLFLEMSIMDPDLSIPFAIAKDYKLGQDIIPNQSFCKDI